MVFNFGVLTPALPNSWDRFSTGGEGVQTPMMLMLKLFSGEV